MSLAGKSIHGKGRRVDHEAGAQGSGTMPPLQLMDEGRTETGSGSGTASGYSQLNHTGLPDKLKSGVENLSGFSLDDVKVHYNSSKPKDLQAHAYAQGTDIHIAPGKEKHLPHEAWHVVQQKQGRVETNTQFKGLAGNDDQRLEKEADLMGAKALHSQTSLYNTESLSHSAPLQYGTHTPMQQKSAVVQRDVIEDMVLGGLTGKSKEAQAKKLKIRKILTKCIGKFKTAIGNMLEHLDEKIKLEMAQLRLQKKNDLYFLKCYLKFGHL